MPNNIIAPIIKSDPTVIHHSEDVLNQEYKKTTVPDRITSSNDEECPISSRVPDRITSSHNEEESTTPCSDAPDRIMGIKEDEEGSHTSSTVPDRIMSIDDDKEVGSAMSSGVSDCVLDKTDKGDENSKPKMEKETKIKNLNADEAVAIHQLLTFNKSVLTPVSIHRDFANVSAEEAPLLLGINRPLKNSFPIKLYSLLDRSQVDGYSTIISWAEHGRSFKIYNFNLFVKKIMPIYFYQTKMSSFIRQLSTYGFHKITADHNPDKESYYHELFLRGREDLCPWIVRQKKRSLIIGPESEPDLYKFKPMPVSSKTTTVAKPVQYYQPQQQQLPQQQLPQQQLPQQLPQQQLQYLPQQQLQHLPPQQLQHQPQQQPQINIINIDGINMMHVMPQPTKAMLPRKSLLEAIKGKWN